MTDGMEQRRVDDWNIRTVMEQRRVDDWKIRTVIGEFFDAYSDRPYESADGLIRALWDAGYVIVGNYTHDE